MSNEFDALFDAEAETEELSPTPEAKAKKKRGRPATGKRSDDRWISRAFYVEESTDEDLEDEIVKLRREGIKMDKSDLVNSCLIAWLEWRKGEQPSKCLSDISPRRKDK